MASEDTKSGSEHVAYFRDAFNKEIKDCKDSVDTRDVERLMNDAEYATLFLNWSKSDEDAVNLAVKCLKWRLTKKVNDLTIENIGEEAFKAGHLFLLGQSKKGSRILHFRTGMLDKKDRERSMNLLIFWLERIQRKEPGELITFIMDTTGTSMRNSDMAFTTFIIECFTTYFPSMLERIIIYNLPTLLNSIWKLVSKMLSAEQREATVLCGKEGLKQYIDVENLPESMGGKVNFEYSFPPFPDDLDNDQ
ncbi:motile sperm domain-containing protein 2-like isoform X1 [Clavelina lepadiformis]|uniref:motile sperm domain-containing protein 2-like isoform X1 n=2 Tax=Clavelina lepadiformis TaxID=159417 RepID=UPI004042EF4B